MSKDQSQYIIPCPCGLEIRSHEPEAVCANCGTQLTVRNWGKPPTAEEVKAALEYFRPGAAAKRVGEMLRAEKEKGA